MKMSETACFDRYAQKRVLFKIMIWQREEARELIYYACEVFNYNFCMFVFVNIIFLHTLSLLLL